MHHVWLQDFNVNTRNRALATVLQTGAFPHIKLVPFYELTRPRWRWHFGNCTHRPNGWNYETCCDCTHFCFSPAMWHAHLYNLKQVLLTSSVVRGHEPPIEARERATASGGAAGG